MKIGRHCKILWVSCGLILLLYFNAINKVVVLFRPSVYAQIIDGIGMSSTVYMPDLSCSGCGTFNKRYIIDAPAGVECSADKEIFLLILVISRIENFSRRESVRQTWGSVNGYKGHSIHTYFICGMTSDSIAEEKLKKEAAYWGDIVQVDVQENYSLLTHKTMAALNWAVGRCGSHFNFVMKTDDDSFNVPQNFVDYLETVTDPKQAFIGGLCASGEEPNRFDKHKWYVPISVYPGDVYPLHLKGRSYVLSSVATALIISASRDIIFNPMEDVFVTGVCRAVAGISCTCIPGIPRITHVNSFTDCEMASGVIKNVHPVLSSDHMTKLWVLANNKTARDSCVMPFSYVGFVTVPLSVIFFILALLYYCTSRSTAAERNKTFALSEVF